MKTTWNFQNGGTGSTDTGAHTGKAAPEGPSGQSAIQKNYLGSYMFAGGATGGTVTISDSVGNVVKRVVPLAANQVVTESMIHGIEFVGAVNYQASATGIFIQMTGWQE